MKRNFIKPNLVAAVVIAAGIALKLGYALTSAEGGLSSLTYPDEKNYYLAAAQEIRNLGTGFFFTPRSLWNGPVNPLWVWLWGTDVGTIKIANIILGAVTTWLVWLTTRRLFGERPALIALMAVTLHPPFVVFTPTILTEPVFIFFLVASISCFLLNGSRSALLDLGSGVLLGLAALTRPTIQLFPFFLIGCFVLLRFAPISSFRSAVSELQVRRFVLWIAGFLVLVGPYVAKNAFYLGKTGIANGSGAVLYLGNDLRKNGDEPVYSGMDFDTFEITAPFTHLDTEGDRLLTEVAVARMRANPLDSAALFFRKNLRFLFGYPAHYFYPYRDLLTAGKTWSPGRVSITVFEILLTVLFSVTALAGLSTRMLKPGARFLLGSLLLYYVLLHGVTNPIPRLALPLFPFLAIIGSGVLGTWRGRAYTCSVWAVSLCIFLWIALIGRTWSTGVVSKNAFKWFSVGREINLARPAWTQDLQVVGASVEGVTVTVTGSDPYLVYLFPSLESLRNQVVLISLAAEPPPPADSTAQAQLFWSRESPPQFSEERSVHFQITLDGNERTYQLSASASPVWKPQIEALRLDLPDSRPGIRYRISRLALAK